MCGNLIANNETFESAKRCNRIYIENFLKSIFAILSRFSFFWCYDEIFQLSCNNANFALNL